VGHRGSGACSALDGFLTISRRQKTHIDDRHSAATVVMVTIMIHDHILLGG
jgi:hypothetical protein